jgi:glycine/D-amino acid oxidase-like deaminating enzyme
MGSTARGTRQSTRQRSSTRSTLPTTGPSSSEEVFVAGTGIVGSATAYFLSKDHSHHVTLIDSSHAAASASGKAGGFLAASWCDGSATEELARKGFALHEELSGLFTDVGYRFGIDAVSGVLPSVSDGAGPAPGNYRYIGPERRACGQVHPKLLTEALCSEVKKLGGTLRDNTMLREILLEDVDGGTKRVVGVRVLDLESGVEEEIRVEKVLLALGAWTSIAMKECGIEPTMCPHIEGHKVHSIVTKDSREGAKDSLFLLDMEGGGEPECYPRPDGTLYVCGNQGGKQYDSVPPKLAKNVEVEEDGSVEYLREVTAAVSGSCTEAVDIEESQACYLPISGSNKPVISAYPGIKGLFINAGHSCWGILLGPVSGKAMAELIADGKSSCVDLTPFLL